MEELNGCSKCNKECCKSVIVEIDKPESAEDWEDIKWEVAHENVRVLKDEEGDWCIEFLTPCTQLDESGNCKIYDKRPKICRNYKLDDCLFNSDGKYYDLIFCSVKDVENYLLKNPEILNIN